jgi:hypothetical protein
MKNVVGKNQEFTSPSIPLLTKERERKSLLLDKEKPACR